MGYADMAGFRLGTCRPVRWIDPQTRAVSALTLHSLTIMDCSLTDERYMNLDFDEAFEYAVNLINQTKKHHGEVVLLWHNSSLAEGNIFPHKKLYKKLINYITQIHQC
jgi:hypothetical protein